MKAILLLAAVALLSGCQTSGTRSTIKDENIAYAVSKDQAWGIIDSSVRAFISPDYMNPSPQGVLTSSGYFRKLIDTCTINATALPSKGINSHGEIKDGFGFMVNHHGTQAWPGIPDKIYVMIKDQAARQGERLTVK